MSDGEKREEGEKGSLAERILDVFGKKEEGTTLSPVQITRRIGLKVNKDNVETVDTQLFYLERKRVLISRLSVNAYALNYIHLWQEESLAIRYIQEYGGTAITPESQHNKPFGQRRQKQRKSYRRDSSTRLV